MRPACFLIAGSMTGPLQQAIEKQAFQRVSAPLDPWFWAAGRGKANESSTESAYILEVAIYESLLLRSLEVAAVLLIDDMNLVRGAVKTILTRAGHSVTEAAGGEAGIALLQKEQFDLVVTDMIMPDQDGGDVMTFMRGMRQRPAILAVSGGNSDVPAEEALQLARSQADAVMAKPFDNKELIATVDKLLKRAAA
jgi:CheY-like chemotaxis protein